ncbi:hypothetical protein VTN02DRAFT_2484 [Thermoascus thermophilus]
MFCIYISLEPHQLPLPSASFAKSNNLLLQTGQDLTMIEPHVGSGGPGASQSSGMPPRPQYIQVPVAIVGLACRLPGNSNSPTALWDFLERGGIAINEPPRSRFNLRGHYDGSTKPGTMRPPGGMFIETVNPEDFDAAFFRISKADAIAMDPQQRQLLEVVYEALENAGITLEELDGAPVGCFVGSYAAGMAVP